MGMLSLLITALIICWLVLMQMKGTASAPPQRPAAAVKQASADAKVDATSYQTMVKDVKLQLKASMQKETEHVESAQETQEAR